MFFTDIASQNSFCMIHDGGVASLLLRSTSDNLKNFPIYHSLSMLRTDVMSTNNSPYPVSVEQLLKFDIISCDS